MRSGEVVLFGDPAALAPPRVVRESRADGSFVLRHPEPLGPHARRIGDWLDEWARRTPAALFLAERAADGSWRESSYGATRAAVGRIAQGLLQLDLPPEKPVVVLSENAIDHALLALASMHVGRPVCTVSSSICTLARDASRIHAILDMLDPALVYAARPEGYAPAMTSWRGGARGVPLVFSEGAQLVPGALALAALAARDETTAVARAFAAVEPEQDAKFLLTSGSTGLPKVVRNTHRMLCANQQQMTQVWPFLARHPLVLVDWLPWSHTFGGNHDFHLVLAHGGSLYIDDGRPAPGRIEKTLRNLREVRPNFHFNVPRGFDLMLPFLEQDEALARAVFERLEGVFYAGAALSQSLWTRLETLAARVRERPLWFTSSWGSTETAPAVTNVHWRSARAGCIGLPLPGVELKFVPNAGKLELCVRGPNVFPGYRNAPELDAAAFDEEGYFRIGDAGRLVDEEDLEQGVAFDGRVAEDFKLSTGTWVSVGPLRLRALSALSPFVADAVVTGHDRAEVGLLLFLTPQGVALAREERDAKVRAGLRLLAAEGLGPARTPTRARVLLEPPDAEAGEITDKGYLNQRALLSRRAGEVAALYTDDARAADGDTLVER